MYVARHFLAAASLRQENMIHWYNPRPYSSLRRCSEESMNYWGSTGNTVLANVHVSTELGGDQQTSGQVLLDDIGI